jgi:hypothetical protein
MKVGELVRLLEGLDENSLVRLFATSPVKAGAIIDLKQESVYAANKILVRIDIN